MPIELHCKRYAPVYGASHYYQTVEVRVSELEFYSLSDQPSVGDVVGKTNDFGEVDVFTVVTMEHVKIPSINFNNVMVRLSDSDFSVFLDTLVKLDLVELDDDEVI